VGLVASLKGKCGREHWHATRTGGSVTIPVVSKRDSKLSLICKPMGKNMRSAKQNPAVVTDYLLTECAAGRVISPFMFSTGSTQIKQFGVIPKGKSGKWQLISSPEGFSVNAGVDTELCPLQYCMSRMPHRKWYHKDTIHG